MIQRSSKTTTFFCKINFNIKNITHGMGGIYSSPVVIKLKSPIDALFLPLGDEKAPQNSHIQKRSCTDVCSTRTSAMTVCLCFNTTDTFLLLGTAY